jgi:hypothetical protein
MVVGITGQQQGEEAGYKYKACFNKASVDGLPYPINGCFEK